MRRALLVIAGLVFGGLAAASFLVPVSQSSETRFLPMLGNDVVLHLMVIAAGGPSDAEDAADEGPIAPISIDEARRVVDVAAVSAAAAWCGVEWKRSNFLNLMRSVRSGTAHGPQALAYVEKLHDVAMGMFEQDLRATASCPRRHKTEVAQFMAGRWRGGVSLALESGPVRP